MFRLLIVLVLSQAAIAASKVLPLVAVMPLDARKIDTTDALTLRDALSNDLIGTGEVRVMERAQIEAILKEQGFQQSGACDQNDCAVQVGKLLGIDRIVVGSVGKIGEKRIRSPCGWSMSARVKSSTPPAAISAARSMRCSPTSFRRSRRTSCGSDPTKANPPKFPLRVAPSGRGLSVVSC